MTVFQQSVNGLTITFGATNGSMSPPSAPLASLMATSTYTNTSCPGSGLATVSATLDNGTGTAQISVSGPPAITSANNTTFTVGNAGTFTVTKAGCPTPTLSQSGALPSGVTFTPASGVLSGTPAAGTGGTYPITFTASNGVGSNAVQNFTITVNQAPAITSASNTTFTVGTSGIFNVTATGFPAPSVALTSGALPGGVTFNPGTRLLSGTPASNSHGTYSLVFTASNGVGSNAVQNFTLIVNPSAEEVERGAKIEAEPGGGYRVSFIGNPGQQYTVQFCDDLLVANWQFDSFQTANANGMFFIIDTLAAGAVKRFYRVLIPYLNDFNSGVGAATLRGTAAPVSQAIRLTDNIGGQLGAVVIDPTAASGLTGFTAKFNLALGPSPGTPADGASFAAGDLGATAWGEVGPGTAHSLAISFDTFNNGGPPGPGNIGIHIYVNGVAVATNPTNPYTSGVFVPVEISFDTSNGLTVKYNSITIFNNLAIPRLRRAAGRPLRHRGAHRGLGGAGSGR